MKPGIHPESRYVVFQDANTGTQFITRSTANSDRQTEWSDGNSYPLIVVDVTSDSHPFWTGSQRMLDSQGRIEKFNRKYGNRARKGA
jgi:large subunit ribosomal protein L31